MQIAFVGHACAQVKCAKKGRGEKEGRNGTRRGEERKEREGRQEGAGGKEGKGEGDQAVDETKWTNKSAKHTNVSTNV